MGVKSVSGLGIKQIRTINDVGMNRVSKIATLEILGNLPERLYAFGGESGGENYYSDNDEFYQNTWSSMEDIPSPARSRLASTNIYTTAYIFNGGSEALEDFTPIKDTDAYSKEHVWTSKTDSPDPARESPAVATLTPNKAYLFGGFNDTDANTYYQDTDEYHSSDSWTSKTSMPSPGRKAAGAAGINGYGYVFGGYNVNSGDPHLGDTDEYNQAGDSWTSKEDLPWPFTRSQFTTFVTYDKAYICGGYAGGASAPSPEINREVDAYDPNTGWHTRMDMNNHVARTAGGTMSRKGIVCGGQIPGEGFSTQLTDEYDATADSWTAKTDMPTPARNRHAAAVISVTRPATTASGTSTERMFIAGGRDSSFNYLQDTDSYSSGWTSRTDLPSPARSYLAGTEISEKGYVFGGYSGSYLQDNDEYDFDGDSWTSKDSMSSPARRQHAAVTISDKAYVFGGQREGMFSMSDTDEYDPSGGEFTWTSQNSMSYARWGLAASAINSKGYTFGGTDGDSFLGYTEIFDPAGGELAWTSGNSMPSPSRANLSSSPISSKAYIYGGDTDEGGEGWVNLRDVDEYDPSGGELSWTSMTDMPTPARRETAAGTLDSEGYVAGGYSGSVLRDFDSFDPSGGESAWTSVDDIPTPGRRETPASFVIEA